MKPASVPREVVYLDNAATSFPKAPGVGARMAAFVDAEAGNPGRSGHRLALAAGAVVAETRGRLARLLGIPDPARVAFTSGATDALNMALWGSLRSGDRVVATSIEHNAVVRPLRALADSGVEVAFVPASPDGSVDADDLALALRRRTRLVAMVHASNVTGAILPVAELAAVAHAAGATVLVDAAQTAGSIPVDAVALGVDLLAVPGHKGLLGPTGTGALYVAPGCSLRPLRQGGTGTRSEDDRQPAELPEALEAGTLNTVGLAGLGTALRYLEERGVGAIADHGHSCLRRLLDGLETIPGLTVHGPTSIARHASVVSLTLAGWEPTDLAAVLEGTFGIASRAGLHCAPAAHRSLGTFPSGTLRLSPGPFTTNHEIDRAIEALRQLAAVPR
jgi:cysteine desulfurase / selenocysteine lyase